jgi:hypothetical protein
MKSNDLSDIGSMELLTETEVDQIGGALAPLVIYGLIVGGGALLGFGAAAAVHYFGAGSHVHK